jgi:hypothetical protein
MENNTMDKNFIAMNTLTGLFYAGSIGFFTARNSDHARRLDSREVAVIRFSFQNVKIIDLNEGE